jgi:hypothetical protein
VRNRITYAGKEFSDDLDAAYRLTTGDCLLETSALSDSLAANTLEFEVDSEDTNLTQYVRNDKLEYEYKGRRLGTFYMQSVGRVGASSYRFSAVSAVGLLMGKTHYGGLYTGQTVAEVVADIVAGTGVTVEIKTIFRDYQLYGWLPIATARDNLAQVLFAIGAYLRTLSNGVLRITSLYSGVSWARDGANCYTGGSVDYGTPVSRVIVTEHSWKEGSETVELFDGAAEQGDIIRFDEPVHDLKANGFTVLESNCNYAKVSAGTGTLTGTKYIHSMRDVVRDVGQGVNGDDITVKEAYLVSLVNSVGVAERLAEYYAHRETITQDVVWSGEQPGDIVRTAHPYGGTAEIFLGSSDLAMSGILKASEEGIVGYIPPAPEDQTYYDYEDILIGSGDYVIPDEVYSLTVVCIQAGTGAQAGFDGEPGGGTQLIVTTKEQDAGGSWSDTQADGGEGGQKGAPGAGGKVYRATIDVVPGQVIHYECGTPGVGGATNGAVGTAGGETTFGALSSAQGAVSDTGYTDPVSGDVLAKPGTEGVDGAAGGRGGQASSRGGDYGENGEDVPPNTGGPGGPPYGWKFDDYTSENVRIYGGGAGGGAAHGKDGEPGSDSPTAVGGAGASPDVPKTPDKIGAGGNGGHGGGGGGGAGGLFASAEAYGPSELPAGIWITKDGGSAGKGSRGSNGGPGGILVYYQQPKTSESGRFRARGGQLFFGRGRQIFAV